MVRSGLTIAVTMGRPQYRPGEEVTAQITAQNTGVGHHVPTYVTPRITVRAMLLDATGRQVPGSLEERVIARDVTLDLSRELFDSRIPAGGRFVMDYRRRVDRAGLKLGVRITVYPDHFYARFFESLLASGARRGAPDIRRALDATRRSVFELYRRDIPLT